jgi:hypothetical protein
MNQPILRLRSLGATLLATSSSLVAMTTLARADEPTVLRGHVLLPDGKPAAGAGIYWVQFKAPPPRKPEDIVSEKRAVADDEGRFKLTLTGQDAPLDKQPRPLIAYLPGYGVDWAEIVQDQVPDDAVLQLVKDNSIRGRVTDTEGRHVSDAKVTVRIIAASSSGSLDAFLEAWRGNLRNPGIVRSNLERQCYAARLLPLFTTVTDREGRFELSGVGAERLASVNISAPGLVSEDLEIVNRDGFDAAPYNKAAQAGMLPQMRMARRLTGPAFEHVGETELVIRGTVFIGADRKPVVRAIVSAQGGGVNNPISAQTDERGHFELRGLRRSQDSNLIVYGPQGSNLLFRSRRPELAPGQTVVDVEIEMKEGVFVEGRVFDLATGHGVRSGVQFVPLPGNEYAELRGPVRQMAGNPTDDEGHFRMLVMPGPGVLMAQVQRAPPGFLRAGNQRGDIKPVPYRQASFSEEDSKRVVVTADGDDRYFKIASNMPERLMSHNAVKVIDLAPGSEGATFDLPLDPGKTAIISIEDDQGQPVSDVVVGGVADSGPSTFKIADATCTVLGLGADRPRYVCVLEPARHLAASVTLTGDEQGPVTVRLSPTASIVGRAQDPDGEPLADAVLQIVYVRRSVWDAFSMAARDKVPLKTDADGRFRIENVPPGERLTLGFRQGDKFFGGPRITDEKRQLAPGETLDLGEFKAKELQ